MAAFFASLAVVGSGFASLLPPNANAGSAYKMDEETSTTASLLVGFESADDDASIVTVHFLPSFALFFFFKEEDFVNVWWRDECAEDESVNMCATSIGRCCCRALRSEVSFALKSVNISCVSVAGRNYSFFYNNPLENSEKIRKISREVYIVS